jgi:hypothetical protein
MAMSQKSRTQIYQTFEPLLGEVATEEMLAQFPARDLDQPVTVAHLRAEMADLRAEIRTELQTEIGGLRAELHDGLRQVVMWLVATQAAFLAVVVTVVALLR